MPRHPRDYFLSDFLHVMVQGDEKKFIFSTILQKEKYLYYMHKAAAIHHVEVIAYCIMGNHVHLLLYCREIENISQMLHQCNTTYGIYYNKQNHKVGHVFRDRFKSETIDSQEYLINCIKYIHQNPVKAGLCKRSEEYPHSSASAFKMGLKDYLMKSTYFNKEDFDRINAEETPEGLFLEDDNNKIDIKELLKYVEEKNLVVSEMTDKEFGKEYLLIKKQYRVSDDTIAYAFGISRSKMRRILKKDRIK